MFLYNLLDGGGYWMLLEPISMKTLVSDMRLGYPHTLPHMGRGCASAISRITNAFEALYVLCAIPVFGRFYGSRGCFSMLMEATLAKNLPHRSRDNNGFTHGRVIHIGFDRRVQCTGDIQS
jgi:hypothetical protein